MTFRFTTSAQRALLLLVVLGLALSLAAGSLRHWFAARAAAPGTVEGLERAVALEPSNAAYWSRLGRRWQFDPERRDLGRALGYYRRATGLNPRQADPWLDLAEAYEAQGSLEAAEQAFAAADRAHPVSLDVAWRRGNYLVRRGRPREALPWFRRALSGFQTVSAHLVIDRAWRAGAEADAIVREALPPEPRFYLEALNYFVRWEEVGGATAAWRQLEELGRPFRAQDAVPYLELLLRRGQVDQAQAAWVQVLRLGAPERLRGAGAGELIANGDFEQELLGGGFEWRSDSVAGARMDFDPWVRHSGERSLRLHFDGTANLDFQHLRQIVLVRPRTRYRFRAYVRTEDLSSESGIRFRLTDVGNPSNLDRLTENLVGSREWTRVEEEFVTGPETRLLSIFLRRLPSRWTSGKLSGTAWLDQVSLEELPQ